MGFPTSLLVLCCPAFLLAGFVAAEAHAHSLPAEKHPFHIVPGKCIGLFRVGVSPVEFGVLGEGDGEQTQGRKAYFWWPPDSRILSPLAPYFMEFHLLNSRGHFKVGVIRVTSHRYATSRGISTHSTFEQIKHAFPKLKQVYESDATPEQGVLDVYIDDEQGIAFEIRKEPGKQPHPCYSIEVYPPHTGGPAWMPPLAPAD